MNVPAPPSAPHAPAVEAGASDPLRAFLSGKRQSERHPCHVPAMLEGALAPVAVTLLDVSHGGALLQIDEPAFLEAEAGGGTQAYLELLQMHGRSGLALSFPAHGWGVPAEVVRWTAGIAAHDVSRVGLRFARVLSDEELVALRTGTTDAADGADDVDEVPSLLPWAPRRGVALQVLVFRALKPEVGPLIVGHALGLAPKALALRVGGHRPLIEVAGLLAGHNLFFALQERGRVLWESVAHVAWVAPVSDGSAVDVALLANRPHDKAVLKPFRRV